VRLPAPCYPLAETVALQFPDLRPAQRRGLVLWVYGAVLAKSACEAVVVTALCGLGSYYTIRQYLREFLRDGAAKRRPCQTELQVSACFVPLLRWLLSLWQGRELLLAIDVTTHQDRLTAIVVSVLYRGRAVPIAWHILPGNQKGAFLPPLLELLTTLAPAVPRGQRVVVLTDRGLWSPRLYRQLRQLHWHPVMRVQTDVRVYLGKARSCAAASLTPQPGQAWLGRAVVHKQRAQRLWLTVAVVWTAGHKEPWVLFTDLPPRVVGVMWYGLRMWIECGFRDLKSFGWDWEHSRRTDPTRVARHWLVLAVASLWVLAAGSAAEDAGQPLQGPPLARTGQRPVSVFQRGLAALLNSFLAHRPVLTLWLRPERWPVPASDLQITYHTPPPRSLWADAYLPL
jgi:hypothetical protein